MSQPELVDVFEMLFNAPVTASARAERAFRGIWSQWLKDLAALLDALDEGGALSAQQKLAVIKSQLSIAPVLKLEADVEVGVIMKLVTVTGVKADGTLGLGVGPFKVAGSFGFNRETSQESTLSANARYKLGNTSELSLSDMLSATGLEVTDQQSARAAAAKLEKAAKAPEAA